MVEIEVEDFEAKVQDSKYVLDFMAGWCPPCKIVAPILEEIEKETGIPVYKINIDNLPGAAERYGIRSIPTIILMEDGKPKDMIVGSAPKAKFLKMLGV